AAEELAPRVPQRAQTLGGQLERDEEEGGSPIAALEGGILGGTAGERASHVGLPIECSEQRVAHQLRAGSIEGNGCAHRYREELGDGSGESRRDEAVGPARLARQRAPS